MGSNQRYTAPSLWAPFGWWPAGVLGTGRLACARQGTAPRNARSATTRPNLEALDRLAWSLVSTQDQVGPPACVSGALHQQLPMERRSGCPQTAAPAPCPPHVRRPCWPPTSSDPLRTDRVSRRAAAGVRTPFRHRTVGTTSSRLRLRSLPRNGPALRFHR